MVASLPATVGDRTVVSLATPLVPRFFRLTDPSGDWSVGAGGNLVRNGGFEEFDQGFYGGGALGAWDLRIGSGSDKAGVCANDAYLGVNASEGSKLFDLGMGGWVYGNSRLEQRLSLVAGQRYSLSFDWGAEYDLGTNFQVRVGDLDVQLSSSEGTFGNPWIQHSESYQFTAQGADVLSFLQLSSDNWGLVLDNVRVVPAP
jgi:hypothetical protein